MKNVDSFIKKTSNPKTLSLKYKNSLDIENEKEANKSLLNAINSQILDQYKFNSNGNIYYNIPHLQIPANSIQVPYTINTIPGLYQPMCMAPTINSNNLNEIMKNTRRKKKEEDEISHFSGNRIDLNNFYKKKDFTEEKGKNGNTKSIRTNKAVKELNENLEDFQFEFTRQISILPIIT